MFVTSWILAVSSLEEFQTVFLFCQLTDEHESSWHPFNWIYITRLQTSVSVHSLSLQFWGCVVLLYGYGTFFFPSKPHCSTLERGLTASVYFKCIWPVLGVFNLAYLPSANIVGEGLWPILQPARWTGGSLVDIWKGIHFCFRHL